MQAKVSAQVAAKLFVMGVTIALKVVDVYYKQKKAVK